MKRSTPNYPRRWVYWPLMSSCGIFASAWEMVTVEPREIKAYYPARIWQWWTYLRKQELLVALLGSKLDLWFILLCLEFLYVIVRFFDDRYWVSHHWSSLVRLIGNLMAPECICSSHLKKYVFNCENSIKISHVYLDNQCVFI
jgi:hypothetical protein